MNWIFTAMGVFVEHPLLAAVIGILFVTLGRVLHRSLATAAGVMWIIYSLWEFAIKQRWVCRGDCDIRADLIFIYPLLILGSVAAVVGLVIKPRQPRANS